MPDATDAPEVKQGAGQPVLPGDAAAAARAGEGAHAKTTPPEGATDTIGDTTTKAQAVAGPGGLVGSGRPADGEGFTGSGEPGDGAPDVNAPGLEPSDPNEPIEEATGATGHPEPRPVGHSIIQDNVSEPGVQRTHYADGTETVPGDFAEPEADVEVDDTED